MDSDAETALDFGVEDVLASASLRAGMAWCGGRRERSGVPRLRSGWHNTKIARI